MIHNEHERRVTIRKHADLQATLDTRLSIPIPKNRDREMHQLVNDGIRAQLEQLHDELDAYDALSNGDANVELPDIDNLGEQLISSRIAAGLSQQQLAELTGLAEGVIRRYERDRYASTSFQRLTTITQVLRSCRRADSAQSTDRVEPVAGTSPTNSRPTRAPRRQKV